MKGGPYWASFMLNDGLRATLLLNQLTDMSMQKGYKVLWQVCPFCHNVAWNMSVKTRQLGIEFCEVYAGVITYRLFCGTAIFDGSFTASDDPLPELKQWLESIAGGVKHAVARVRSGGSELLFDMDQKPGTDVSFKVSESSSRNIILQTDLSRVQLVRTFYNGLLDFASSSAYNPDEWEVTYEYERLSKKLSMDVPHLIDTLCRLDRYELRGILSSNVTIPEEFDAWSTERQRSYVEECIIERADGYTGMKLRDFRSRIIEDFIADSVS